MSKRVPDFFFNCIEMTKINETKKLHVIVYIQQLHGIQEKY